MYKGVYRGVYVMSIYKRDEHICIECIQGYMVDEYVMSMYSA